MSSHHSLTSRKSTLFDLVDQEETQRGNDPTFHADETASVASSVHGDDLALVSMHSISEEREIATSSSFL